MPWARLDDGFWRNPKVTGTSDAAAGVYCKAISYCADNLTDGVVPPEALEFLCRNGNGAVDELLDRQLIRRKGASVVIPDYLDYNPSRAEVLDRRRELSEVRAEAGRRGGLATQAARRKQKG